jgi:hypothetical protein
LVAGTFLEIADHGTTRQDSDSGRTPWIRGLMMGRRAVPPLVATALLLTVCRVLPAQAEFPDLGSIAADISVPRAEETAAAAGRRTFVRLDDQKPEIGYVVYLPANWEPNRKWPVFVELPGNGDYQDAIGDQCSGLPEDCVMGYGLTEGRDWIWVCLPLLNGDGSAIARQWWGDAPAHDPAATLRFWRAALADVHRRFAGDPKAVVLAGFSRGAIACNALGLHDDDTAALWAAFLPCSHYDGVRPWPFPGSDREAAERRLRRLGPRPQFICGEGDQTEATRAYLASTSVLREQLTIVSTGFRNHSDRWTLRPCAARSKAREWLASRGAFPRAEFVAQQWSVFETSFSSGRPYDNAFLDLQVDVVFRRGDDRWTVPAFWAGGDTWSVRFAPPMQGVYSFQVECSDPANAPLREAAGTLRVMPSTGENPMLEHGFLRVAADKRHFEHADGTPFLWLGDTWWKNLSKRLTWEGFQELTADRKAKGFNVVQIVCGPYPDEQMMEARWENEGGMPYTNRDFSVVNPAYFEFADRRIRHLVESGIVPVIFGGWGRPQAGGKSTLEQVGLDGFKRHWRNLIARYGAYPVIWAVGGEAKDEYGPWSELARYVKATDPLHHPLTYHAPAHPRHAIKDNAPFDFDMIGIGHEGHKTATKSLDMMRSCLSQEPSRPALCGEACYEGHMQTNFQDLQRHLFWSFMLSGAAGHTYGAAGVWQASVEGDPGIDPVYDWTTWREGMEYPGSTQVGIGKKLLENYPWARFEVHPEWGEPDCFAAGIPRRVRFIYQPKRGIYDWRGVVVKGLEPNVRYTGFYFDPVSGRRFDQGIIEGQGGEYASPRLPSPQDWLLVLENSEPK